MKFLLDVKYVLKIQLLRIQGILIFYALIQIFMALGIIVGFSYMFETADANSTLFLATGAPTFIIIMTGLVGVPMEIGKSKTAGFIEFSRTWPINRAAILISDTIIWLCVMIPSILVSTIAAHFIVGPGYNISWTIIPGFLLSGIAAIGVGYGFSHLVSEDAALTISQIIGFGALMFSPINYPASRLPGWLETLHKILPIQSIAQIMRASLASTTFTAEIEDYINITIWCVLGFCGALYVLRKKS